MRLSVPRKSGPSKVASQKTPILFVAAIALMLTGTSMIATPAYSALVNPGSAFQYQIKDASSVIEVRRGGGGGGGRHVGGGGRRPGGGGHFAGGRRPGGGGQFAGGRRPGGGGHFAGAGRPGVGRPGVGRPGVGRPGVGRPGVVAGGGRWVRPYRWRPGGAIAAGAAIGFVTAATAAAWAGAPPVAGYCWYYTDFTQTQGFWDVCP